MAVFKAWKNQGTDDDMTADELEFMRYRQNEETRDTRRSTPKRNREEKDLGWNERKTKKFNSKQNKRTLIFVSKLMFLVGALGLVSVSALRFTIVNTESIHEVLMNFYYLFFGLILVISQLKLNWVSTNFRFLNYHWGKALFCVFLSAMSCSTTVEAFIQYVISIYFLVCAGCFVMLAICDRQHDLKLTDRDELELVRTEQQESVLAKDKQDVLGLAIEKMRKKHDQAKEVANGVKQGVQAVQQFGSVYQQMRGIEGDKYQNPQGANPYGMSEGEDSSDNQADESSPLQEYRGHSRFMRYQQNPHSFQDHNDSSQLEQQKYRALY